MARPRLVDVFPGLAAQIRASFLADGLPRLAEAIDRLEIVAPCGCGDTSRGSFYTSDHTEAVPFPAGHETLMTDADIPIDVVGDQILYIELLGHCEIYERLMRLFPGAK
jgi:hypothetical protein